MAPVPRYLTSRRLNISPYFQCFLTSTILVTFLAATCAGTAKQWTLTSPQFPNFYPARAHYVWEIITAPQDRISLTFNVFDLENGSKGQCINDNVVISSLLPDGETQSHGKFCGFGPPPPIISTTNRLRIEFFSDANTQKTGFSAVYSAETNASSVFKGWNGTITSPSFPNSYPKNTHYFWEIIAGRQEPTRMTLNFTHFDLEALDGSTCPDYVICGFVMPDGKVATRYVYCGFGLPSPMTVDTDHMHVEFGSDSGTEKTGFSAVYSIGKTGGATFEGPSRTIKSPQFPDFYPANKEIVWDVFAGQQAQDRVRLNFTYFDLEERKNGIEHCFDTVSVKSMFDDGSERAHGIYCGFGVPPSITSVSNQLRIEFKSDGGKERSGFSAVYTTGVSLCAQNSTECNVQPSEIAPV